LFKTSRWRHLLFVDAKIVKMGEEEPAPEMETVVITRAFKAAAAVMGFGCFLLAIVTSGATSWHTVGAGSPYTTMGLFETCEVLTTDPADVANEGSNIFECKLHEEVPDYLAACQALMIIVDVVVFVSFISLSVGICSAVAGVKFTLYKVGIAGYLSAVVLLVIVLILYPTMALSAHDGDDEYAIGWVYVVAWVNTGLLFASALAVIIDKGEELTEREKVPDEEEGEEE